MEICVISRSAKCWPHHIDIVLMNSRKVVSPWIVQKNVPMHQWLNKRLTQLKLCWYSIKSLWKIKLPQSWPGIVMLIRAMCLFIGRLYSCLHDRLDIYFLVCAENYFCQSYSIAHQPDHKRSNDDRNIHCRPKSFHVHTWIIYYLFLRISLAMLSPCCNFERLISCSI